MVIRRGQGLGGCGKRGIYMNKVYQVIWNQVRHGYVVVSEAARTHGRRGGSAGRRALMAAVLAAAAVTGGVVPGMTVYAAPSPDEPAPAHDYRLVENPDANSGGKYAVDKDGKFHLKVKDDASGDAKSIELNGVAVVYGGNKALKSTDAAGAGNEVKWNSATRDTTTSITLGKDTWVSVQGGYSEKTIFGFTIKKPSKGESILFGDTKHTGGIAIGENVKSLNSSVVLGINGYKGKLGNVDLKSYNPKEPLGVASTSVGSNSFVSGTFTSNVGAYNISSTDYLNGDNGFANSNAFQNFGSVMVGSLNSIESKGSGQSTAGNSNGLIGIANKAQNSNGSLIFGTGNEITNSIKDISSFSGSFEVPESAAFAADAVREAVQSGRAGGAVLAVGGGNKADHTTMAQLLGVQNIVNNSTLTMTTGYMNTVQDSNNVSVIGTRNTVSGDSNVVIGDMHSVQGKDNVVLGSADTLTETVVNGAVVLGHNANVHENGGVALGENSVASVAAGKVGYLGAAGTEDAVWKSKAAAVSVGAAGMTRQITHVAAGTEDTDAVNVAQLKHVAEAVNAGWNLSTGGGNTANVAPGDTVDFSGADSNVSITRDGTNVKVKLADDITVNSVTAGQGKIGGVTIGPKRGDNLSVVSGVAPGRIAADSTDAVNGSQLHALEARAGKSIGLTVNQNNTENPNLILSDSTDSNGRTVYDVKVAEKVQLGTEDGKTVVLDGTAGLVTAGTVKLGLQDYTYKGITDQGGYFLTGLGNTSFRIENGAYRNYEGSGRAATEGQLYDAFHFLDKKIDNISIKGDGNVVVSPDGRGNGTGTGSGSPAGSDPAASPEWKAGLNHENVTLGTGTAHVTLEGNNGNVTATGTVTAGAASISSGGVKMGNKTYISKDGLDANGQKVTHVAAGEVSPTSTDAVNGSQLYETNQRIQQSQGNIAHLAGSVNRLGNRMNRVGAGAAALAALHPLDFDPDAKWDFAAGYGHYNGANAVSVGAYYRPNEDVMLSVGGSLGGGENMVNAGISLKLGTGASNVNNSKVAMDKEIKDLRKELEEVKSLLRDSQAGRAIDTSKLQLFPDVAQNHWAYEYVAQLAGNGIIKGYPDGTFDGSRPMTRYEFAAMLYRAMTNGAVLSSRILTEFAPELERFTVDTVHTDKDGKPTVERVRVAKKVNG